MIQKFKDEFYWMLRESKGYFPWVRENNYRLRKFVFDRHHRQCPECHDIESVDLIRTLLNEIVFENDLIDLFFKSLLRAEIRFISRYIPQRSNEERLTGNLVSELDNSIYLVKDEFKDFSIKRYSEPKEVDFFYFDLSRGGKVEKDTGADLGFIIVIDLPDYPFTVKSVILQAKKINGNVQINGNQYETLNTFNEGNCAYLFYDMNYQTLSSPIVLKLDDYDFKKGYEASKEKGHNSFSMDFKAICDGDPLSIFLISTIIYHKFGKSHNSLEDALHYFNSLIHPDNRKKANIEFNGRVGIVSLGRRINYNINNNESLRISF